MSDEWVCGTDKDPVPYDKYVKNIILKKLAFKWLREAYNYTLERLRESAKKRDKNSYTYKMLYPILSKLENSNIEDIVQLIEAIETEEKAKAFVQKYNLTAKEIKNFIEYVNYALFPKKEQLRQYISTDDPQEFEYFEILKKHKLANNYILLELGRTKEGREKLAERTGIPEEVILDFVNRFDVGRIPFFSGRSVKHMWRAGYRSLEDVRNADPEDMTKRVIKAFHSVGLKIPNDFKKAFESGDMIEGWKKMPTVVKS